MTAEAEKKKHEFKMRELHMAIVFFIIIAFRFIPPVGQITPAGMHLLGILIAGIYGWIFVDLLLPSIVCLLAVGLSDAVTMTEFFQNGIGSQTLVMVLGILFLTAYITETNLSDVIVNWIMSRKVVIGRPYVCLLFFLLACFCVAAVSNGVVTCVLFLPLYRSLAKQAGIPAYDKMNLVYLAGIGMTACLGEVCLPFKPFILIVIGMLGGIDLNVAQLTAFTFPATLSCIFFYVAFCKFILRIDGSKYVITDLSMFQLKVSKRQILGLLSILLLLVALLVPNFMPSSFVLNRIGSGGTVLALLVLMMLIPVENEPLLDIRATGRNISWDIFFNCIYFAPMGSLLTSDVTGIKATISTVFTPILSTLPPYLLVVAILVLVVVLTNFLNNAIVAMVFIALSIVLAESVPGLNLFALIMMILIGSFFSLVTPAANAAVAFLFAQKDLMHAKDFMLHGLISCTALVIFTGTVLYAYANVIF